MSIWNIITASISNNYKTNITKQFLHLLDKYFCRNLKYYKIFNGNNVKISHSYINNMKNIIGIHNKKITNSYNKINGKTCNCRNKSNSPLDNKCLTEKTVHKLKLKPAMASMCYLQKFILVSVRQNLSPRTATIQFSKQTRENDSEISKFISRWKVQNKDFDIKWPIF